MHLYNVEILTPNYEYRSSCQTMKVDFEEDYLSPSANKVELVQCEAQKGDYIIITGKDIKVGIVTGHSIKKAVHEVQYKSMMTLLDFEMYMDRTTLKDISLEEWIATQLNNAFRDNEDSLQNIAGFSAIAEPKTYNAVLSLESNIANLYEVVKEALLLYQVVVKFVVNISKKEMTVTVRKAIEENPVIEADLPNILDKNFTLKQADGACNKMIVYNELNENQRENFYMLQDGSVSSDSNAEMRITPVISQSVYISYEENDEQTFSEAAYEKAFSSLVKEKDNCLIELEVMNNDTLIEPDNLEIGQRARIISEGMEYDTLLTGKSIKKTTTLIFGAVRLELTKILKGRMHKK